MNWTPDYNRWWMEIIRTIKPELYVNVRITMKHVRWQFFSSSDLELCLFIFQCIPRRLGLCFKWKWPMLTHLCTMMNYLSNRTISFMSHDWFESLCSLSRLLSLFKYQFRSKKDGTKVFSMGKKDYFHRTMSHESPMKPVNAPHRLIDQCIDWLDHLGAKKDPLTKRKPSNGLNALVHREVDDRISLCFVIDFSSGSKIRFSNIDWKRFIPSEEQQQ